MFGWLFATQGDPDVSWNNASTRKTRVRALDGSNLILNFSNASFCSPFNPLCTLQDFKLQVYYLGTRVNYTWLKVMVFLPKKYVKIIHVLKKGKGLIFLHFFIEFILFRSTDTWIYTQYNQTKPKNSCRLSHVTAQAPTGWLPITLYNVILINLSHSYELTIKFYKWPQTSVWPQIKHKPELLGTPTEKEQRITACAKLNRYFADCFYATPDPSNNSLDEDLRSAFTMVWSKSQQRTVRLNLTKTKYFWGERGLWCSW